MKTASKIWNIVANILGSALFIVLVAGNTAPQCGIIEPEEPVCDAAADCSGLPHIMCEGAWACEEGLCKWDCDIEPEPEPEEACINNLECAAGQHCSVFDGVCDPAPGCIMGEADCPMVCYGTCIDDEPEPEIECQVDEECGEGFICEIFDCISPPCKPGAACPAYCMPAGKCVPQDEPGDCESDADCPPGSLCLMECAEALCFSEGDLWCEPECFSTCQEVTPPPPPPDCMDDSDCPPGYECAMPVTCYEGQADSGAMPCDAAPEFVAGQCVPSTEPEPECNQDSDCGPGFECDISVVCEMNEPSSNDAPKEKCYHYGVCVDDQEPEYCFSDEECPAGFYCQMDPDSYCLMGDEDDSDPSFAPDAYCMGTCVDFAP